MSSDAQRKMSEITVLSYGGGVQSNALLVLAAQGRLHFDAVYFANVGHDSENPATLNYIETVARPYAQAHGIEITDVQVTRRDGTKDTLLQAIERRQGSVVIPALVDGSGVSKRTCTVDFKVRVINRAIRQRWPGGYVRMGIGFSTDEWTRARDTDWHDRHAESEVYGFWRQNYYPLLEMKLSRADCHRIISAAGLPTPPKSSCYFCPYHRRGEWVEMKQREPELFEQACRIDELLATRHMRLQGKGVYLHPDRKPLREAVPDQMMMFADDEDHGCDSGHCLT